MRDESTAEGDEFPDIIGGYLRDSDNSNAVYRRCVEIDDAANGTHDYLRYLKLGYGRATDHATREIRHGRMTRKQGIELVERYDHRRPYDLDFFLDFLDMTEAEFEAAIEDMRDSRIWERDNDGEWSLTDYVGNHVDDPGVGDGRPPVEHDGHWTDIGNPNSEYGDRQFITLQERSVRCRAPAESS